MPQIPFVGPSYTIRSVNFDCQRSVNIYPERSESGDSKAVSALVGTPGREVFCTLPDFPIRGEINVNGRPFFVAANKLYELFIDGTFTTRGQFTTATGAVSIDTNGSQICIVTNPEGFIYDLTTNTLTQITDPYYLGAITVTFADGGYFAFNKPDSQVAFLSALYDGLTGDPLDFFSAEGSPDNLVAVKTVHQQLWMFGTATVQPYSNTGGADLPFTAVQGALMEYGCAAPYSVVVSANTVFWMGQDNDGNGTVWMTTGYQPVRISTYAIEFKIQQYKTINDAVGYTYQEDGHFFYVINFPTANTTFVFDVKESLWHERAYFNDGEYSRDRAQGHVFVFGKHLVGDYENGNVYNQDLSIYHDNGQSIRRMRTFPHLAGDLQYIYFNQLQIDMETGIGVSGMTADSSGGAFDSGFDSGFDIGISRITFDPDTDPQIMLRWSNDGGHAWSNEYWVSAGKIGEYKKRAIWRRLGRARDRVFEVAFTAKCKVFWIAGHLQSEPGDN